MRSRVGVGFLIDSSVAHWPKRYQCAIPQQAASLVRLMGCMQIQPVRLLITLPGCVIVAWASEPPSACRGLSALLDYQATSSGLQSSPCVSHSLTPMAGRGCVALARAVAANACCCAVMFPEVLSAACRTDHKILQLVSLSEDLNSTEWQLADVRANRGGPPTQLSKYCVLEKCELFSTSCREGQSQAF